MIPAPPPPTPAAAAREFLLLTNADLRRAAVVAVALEGGSQVLVTRECLSRWPNLAHLDVRQLEAHCGRQVLRDLTPLGIRYVATRRD